MIYQSCSMKGVIGRIIRNTRIQDASYIADMHDWIYEAMRMMEVKQSLRGNWEDVNIVFHKAKLPCGLVYIDAVEYNGCRIPRGNSVRPASKEKVVFNSNDHLTIFQTKVDKIVPIENHLLYTTMITAVDKQPLDGSNYYDIELGWISFSKADATITVYFKQIPTDEDGLPLIPDNENFKQAIYWYCRGMMIGSGYPDNTFRYHECIEYHEMYAGRALAEMTYPSPDEMEHKVNTLVRFLPQTGYYENFFRTDGREPFYETRNL